MLVNDGDTFYYRTSHSSSKMLPISITLQIAILLLPLACAQERPICVPRGSCILNKNGGIDVRLILPDEQGKCPAGRDLCYQNVDATRCSYVYNNSLPTRDGAAPYGAHPWLVYIVNQTGYTGSGVLLDRYHVLTAAHKLYRNRNALQKLDVYVGVHNSDSLPQAYKRTIEDILFHPNFDPVTLRNDLAVFRLKAHIPLGYQKNVATACLPKNTAKFVNERCMVAGWGDTSFNAPNAPTYFLKQVTVPIVPYQTCRSSMINLLGNNTDAYLDRNGELCAGGETGKDACTDDGGSPLMCTNSNGRKVIAGLVIWGKKCGRANTYGVYVDVAKYVDWINRAVQNLQA